MMQALRVFLASCLAALISAGLIGCTVFSGAAAAQPAADAGMVMHAHGDMHDMAGPHAGHHDPADTSSCEDCNQSLLHRVVTAPDKPVLTDSMPAPFIVPQALRLDPVILPARMAWPPGPTAPLRPLTLTHQKISLLI
ncbi:hypothetical protein [Henriciella aquimarina]|uniref:hypothetical protein n=1 Tax=Henriciella aquimarina TaxID=545261 RepID=UPI000A073B12|nr:hypothetical protein [Henriciella aquimarina]